MIVFIEQKGEDHVRYQGVAWRIATDNRNPKYPVEIFKEWGETLMRKKTRGLSYGAFITVEISRGTLIVVCDES